MTFELLATTIETVAPTISHEHFDAIENDVEDVSVEHAAGETGVFKCSQCGAGFSTKYQLKKHVRIFHQVVLKIGQVVFERQPDGSFNCGCGAYSSANPELLRQHVDICRGADSDTEDQPVGGEDGNEAVLDLALYRLAFHQEFGVLECLKCHHPVGRRLQEHLSRCEMDIPRDVARLIVRRYVDENNPYLNPSQNGRILPQLPFLKPIEAFGCQQCTKMFKTDRYIFDHLASEDHEGYRTTWVYDLGHHGGMHSYIEIEPPAVINEHPITVHNKIRATIAAGRLSAPVGPIRPDPFLQSAHIRSAADINECRQLAVYSDIVGIQEPEQFATMSRVSSRLLQDMMDTLRRTDPAVRAIFGGDRILEHPQRDETVEQYKNEWLDIIIFAVNFSRARANVPNNIKTLARNFYNNPTMEALLCFINGMTSQKALNGMDVMVFNAFMKSRFFGSNGVFLGANLVSRLANQVIYLMKLSALNWIITRTSDEEQDQASVFIDKNFGAEKGNAFSAIVLMMGQAQKVDRSEFSAPIVLPLEEDDCKLEVDGIRVALEDIRDAYASAYAKVVELQNWLGLNRPFPKIKPQHIDARMSSRTANYGITCKNGQKQVYLNQFLLAKLVSHPELSERFIESDDGETFRFKSEAVAEYVAKYDEYTRHVLVLIHMGSGMPARGTELASYSIVNDVHHPRVLQFCSGKVVFISSYNKTNAIRGANQVIARSLCWEHSRVILRDILIIRPFLCSLLACVNDDRQRLLAMIYQQRQFVMYGRAMTGDDIRNAFTTVFRKLSGGKRVLFGSYRHLAKYFVNLFKLDDGLLAQLDANISQFGHSASVGTNAYGIASDESELMRTRTLHRFMRLSTIWHQFLCGFIPESSLVPALRMVQDSRRRPVPNRGRAVNQNRPRTTNRVVDIVDVDVRPVLDTTVADVAMEPAVQDDDGRVSSDGDDGPNPMAINLRPIEMSDDEEDEFSVYETGEVVPLPVSRMLKPSSAGKLEIIPRHYTDASLGLLRTFLGDQAAQFRCPEQRTAVEMTLYTDMDIVAVLATGLGKSLLFFLFAINRPDFLSVVIVPTVSLRDDLIRRGTQLGVKCANSVSSASTATLLFLTPESLNNPRVYEYFITAVNQRRLGRIFVDEAHCVLSDRDFRPSFSRVFTLRRFNIPVTLLTATLPASRLTQLCSAFYIDPERCAVITTPSNRPNHFYSVREYRLEAEILDVVVHEVSQSEANARFIMYCTSISDVNRIHSCLSDKIVAFKHNSECPESAANVKLWREQDRAVMVATSGFGAGIDYPAVRAVMLMGVPYSFADLIQQFGRAGRDGLPAKCILFYHRGVRTYIRHNVDPVKRAEYAISDGFIKTDACRRRYISQYLEGAQTGCEYYIHCIKCDNCSVPPPMAPPEAERLPDDRVSLRVSHTANIDFNATEAFACEIRTALDRWRGKCIICSLSKGRLVQLDSKGCKKPNALCHGRCLRCFGRGHTVDRCPAIELRANQRPKDLCCWCLMPFHTLASNTHHGQMNVACRDSDTIRNVIMAARELQNPVMIGMSPRMAYEQLHQVSDTMGHRYWLNGHIMFLSILKDMVQFY